MIKKYKLFTEGILDKLKGPTEDDVANNLRKNYENGSINIIEYYNKSRKINFSGINYDDLLNYYLSPDDVLVCCFNNLDDKGVEYALEHGAARELYNKLIKMKKWFLDLITDMGEYKSNKYQNLIYWRKNGEILFKQDLEDMILFVNYGDIWEIFEDKYKYKFIDIQSFIKNMVEEYLNWFDFSITVEY